MKSGYGASSVLLSLTCVVSRSISASISLHHPLSGNSFLLPFDLLLLSFHFFPLLPFSSKECSTTVIETHCVLLSLDGDLQMVRDYLYTQCLPNADILGVNCV